MSPSRLLTLLALAASCRGQVKIYYAPGETPTSAASAATASFTGSTAYNPATLNPPPVPDPLPPMSFDVPMKNGETEGLSIKLGGNFMGFSIEMSVANQVLGKNSSFIQVPFLNLMAGLQKRGGSVRIRVGGNTQERANMVDEVFENGRIIIKDFSRTTGTTGTPGLSVSKDLLVLMRGISNLVNVRWLTGIPFHDPKNVNLKIMSDGQAILGDYLLGMQVGNEPDLYFLNGHRDPDVLGHNYNEFDYFGEFGEFVNLIANNAAIPNRTMLMGPSVSSQWIPERVWDTGYLDAYGASLAWLTVEHYPIDNCFAVFGRGAQRDPQALFPTYLTHNAALELTNPYRNSSTIAIQRGKPLIMFETNTASCGGFVGISDVFAAAIWGIDYALQMASASFNGAFFHVGGQSVAYNPFTAPPSNLPPNLKWTIGPIYYTALFVAEAIGPSNNTQVKDLGLNRGNEFTPGYGLWENGQVKRVVLINFINDPSGKSTYTARIAVEGATPTQVKVKYLTASSVSQKGNFTWAGQTFGHYYDSDGVITGTEDIKTVTCTNGACPIEVPAPAAALVFLDGNAFSEAVAGRQTSFPTTANTRTRNTATIEAAALATSNGQQGFAFGAPNGGSTSHGTAHQNGAIGRMWELVWRLEVGVVALAVVLRLLP